MFLHHPLPHSEGKKITKYRGFLRALLSLYSPMMFKQGDLEKAFKSVKPPNTGESGTQHPTGLLWPCEKGAANGVAPMQRMYKDSQRGNECTG